MFGWLRRRNKLGVKGWIIARKKPADEELYQKVFELPVDNTIVNVALADIANHLINGTTGGYTHGAIGTGSTAPAVNQTALVSQILTRKSSTLSRISTSVTNDTAKYVSNFTADASYAVTEYGTFDTSSGGIMLNRVTFSAINLTNGDALEFTYKCQVQRA
jgi:hypothetical protein